MKLKFHVYGGADESVGIWASEATITIEDNFSDGGGQRADAIKDWKEILRDYYDLPEKHCRHFEGVWTEEEYAKMLEDERKEMEVPE